MANIRRKDECMLDKTSTGLTNLSTLSVPAFDGDIGRLRRPSSTGGRDFKRRYPSILEWP